MPRTTSSQILISMHKKGSWKILLSLRSAIPITTIQCTIRELDAARRGNIAWGTRLSPPPIRIWPHPPTPSHGCKQSTHSKIVPVRYCRCKKLVREKLLSALKTNFTKQTISTANQLLHRDTGHVYPRTNYSIQIVSFVNKNVFSEKTTAENIDNVRPLYIASGSLWSSSSLRPDGFKNVWGSWKGSSQRYTKYEHKLHGESLKLPSHRVKIKNFRPLYLLSGKFVMYHHLQVGFNQTSRV